MKDSQPPRNCGACEGFTEREHVLHNQQKQSLWSFLFYWAYSHWHSVPGYDNWMVDAPVEKWFSWLCFSTGWHSTLLHWCSWVYLSKTLPQCWIGCVRCDNLPMLWWSSFNTMQFFSWGFIKDTYTCPQCLRTWLTWDNTSSMQWRYAGTGLDRNGIPSWHLPCHHIKHL